MAKEIFCFEILCVDQNGATNVGSEQSMVHALLFTKKLWKSAKSSEIKNRWNITDDKLKLSVTIKAIDTSKALTNVFDAAFIISIECSDFDELERFRVDILQHLRSLQFQHIKILTDDISKDIANQLYPKINRIENLLRRYLTKFFIQRIGLDWWTKTAPKVVLEKVKKRKEDRKGRSKEKDTLTELANSDDLALVDFDDLGELVYKQSSGFNDPEKVVEKIISIKSQEELEQLKSALQGNYTKYFKESFRDKDFESQWRELFAIRNKVAHSGLLSKRDLVKGLEHSSNLTEIIKEAEEKIADFNISIEEQEIIRQATIVSIETRERLENVNIGALGSAPLVQQDEDNDYYKNGIITEEELLKELKIAENTLERNNKTYVGLKAFVTKILGKKGYSFESTYSLINILSAKGILELYTVNDDRNVFPVTGIRINNKNNKP